jgi:hypothetical protein
MSPRFLKCFAFRMEVANVFAKVRPYVLSRPRGGWVRFLCVGLIHSSQVSNGPRSKSGSLKLKTKHPGLSLSHAAAPDWRAVRSSLKREAAISKTRITWRRSLGVVLLIHRASSPPLMPSSLRSGRTETGMTLPRWAISWSTPIC